MNEKWLQALERKIDLILNRFEIGYEAPPLPENIRQVAMLAGQGKKLEAIKVYRMQTGASLEEAKNFVENLGSNLQGDPLSRIDRKVYLLLQKLEIPFEREFSTDYLREEIKSLLRARNKIEAIRVYREATGLGLKEAKDAVEALERELF